MRTKFYTGTEPEAEDWSIAAMGERIKIARLRRNIPLRELVWATGYNRNTLAALEHGKPGTSLAVLWAVLKHLDMHRPLAKLADPAKDTLAKIEDNFRRENRDIPLSRWPWR